MDYTKEFNQNLAYHFSELLDVALAKPQWVYISLSHKCTYNCQMCSVVKILKGYELEKKLIESSFDEISKWDWDSTVVITGGEPFLRKDIFEIISYGSKKGVKIELVSNGSLINEEMSEKIVNSGLSNIAISLDGATQSTHDFIRQKGAFEKAVNAIKKISEAKKRNNFGPQISIWTTIMKENVGELFDIISVAQDSGAECLVYHPVIAAQDDMQNTSSDAKFWIRADEIRVLKNQIDKIIDYREKNGLIAFLHDPYMWVSHFEGKLTKKDWKCNPFIFINIGPDGEVRSCGMPFGNIKNKSLGECLNTVEAVYARKIMKECLKPCLQTCWAHPDSDSLIGIVENYIGKIKHSGNKNELIDKGLKILGQYETRLNNV